jgi:hypothetical protein
MRQVRFDRARCDSEHIRGADGVEVEDDAEGDDLTCRAGSRWSAAISSRLRTPLPDPTPASRISRQLAGPVSIFYRFG